MNTLSIDKKVQVISALVEGNSIRSTERMTGVHRDTIMRLLVKVGQGCQDLLNKRMRHLHCQRLELDEIWTYVRKKQRKVYPHENRDFGDQFVFVALDPVSKLVPSFAIGKRTPETTWEFVQDVRDRVVGRIQITSDGFRPYISAIDDAFGADVDYAMLIKSFGASEDDKGTYHPSRIVALFHRALFGNPEMHHVSTSIVERQNLTMRMQMRRFTRLTNAFSKKLENLKAAVALHFAHYNFVRIHRTLRVTPAIEAGITDHVWDMGEMLLKMGI